MPICFRGPFLKHSVYVAMIVIILGDRHITRLSKCCYKKWLTTDVFECHQVVNEKNTFALEQFPDRLASFTLDLGDLWRTYFTLTLLVLTIQHLTPLSVLSPQQQIGNK